MSDMQEPHAALELMDKIYGGMVKIVKIVTGFALVLLTVLLGYQVFGRYVLNDTPTWVDPLSLLMIMLIAFLGAANGVQEHTHLSVAIFRNIVPKKVRTAMVLLTDVIMATFGGVLLWYGVLYTASRWPNKIPLIGLSEGWRPLPLTIFGGMILLFSLGHIARVLLKRDHRVDSFE
jgi:TRAP-type C4-dicarboxylate transport system permease small subunit